MSNVRSQRWQLKRRHFLRATGIAVALPLLEAMIPLRARGADDGMPPPPVRRFVCVANPFGMIMDAFFPAEAGAQAALPENLRPLADLRGQFTVFSNLDHGLNGGHAGTHAFLSGVRYNEAAGLPNGNITLDQLCAEHAAGKARFPVLNTCAGGNDGGGCELSWTRTGVMVPAVQKVDRVFRLLFTDDPPGLAEQETARYRERESILDAVQDQARAMDLRLGAGDRRKLEQYFTSIREVEKTLGQENEWVSRPRQKVDMKEPRNGTVTQQLPILFDLIALALQTDSTRVATIEVPGTFDTSGVGLTEKGYHGYSHHGKDPALMAGMRTIENFQIAHLARFLKKLADSSLLDSTQILFGSGMGDGSAHTNRNLPILVAGGGYRHQTHIRMPAEEGKRIPLCNLFLTMARRFGIAADAFGHSTGALREFA